MYNKYFVIKLQQQKLNLRETLFWILEVEISLSRIFGIFSILSTNIGILFGIYMHRSFSPFNIALIPMMDTVVMVTLHKNSNIRIYQSHGRICTLVIQECTFALLAWICRASSRVINQLSMRHIIASLQ